MWTAESKKISNPAGLQFSLAINSQPATFAAVISAWQHDADFRVFFNSLLADCTFTAFRWETPSVTIATLSQPFEFVLIDSPSLARQPESEAFAEHFVDASATVAIFLNLGGDAIMVVPYPATDSLAYGHIAAFVRQAPAIQQHDLWKSIGNTLAKRVNSKPVWLSTAGAGVAWLHVRRDDRPKYYSFAQYKSSNIAT